MLQQLSSNYDKPEYILVPCEMIAKTLVISAEKNFKTSNPKSQLEQKLPHFSKEYRSAHQKHKKVCAEWRMAGRPAETLHPAKAAVISSRRALQKTARDEESFTSINTQNDLMDTFASDINQIYPKLKKARGQDNKQNGIAFIETLAGRFDGKNVLEGFCANTEILCCEDENTSIQQNNEFYKMSVKDNMIIFEITRSESLLVPHMTITNLKDILFKKLKLNKA